MTFKQFLEELENLNAVQQKQTTGAVAKTLQQMDGNQAMKAIQQEDPHAEKKLIARTLAKPQVKSIQQVAPVLGLKINKDVTQ